MASFRFKVIPSRLCSHPSPIRLQRRWAQVHDVRFVATRRTQESIFEKYRGRLEQKAKEEGHESIDSLKKAYQDQISELRLKASSITFPSAKVSESGLQQSPPPAPRPQPSEQVNTKSSSSIPAIKPLSSYLDLEKVSKLPKKQLEYIWRLRHASDPLSLCGAIPIEIYERIHRTAKRHPQFILPLPRPVADSGSGDAKQAAHGFEGGQSTAADIHFLQWGFHPSNVPTAPSSATRNVHTSTVLFTHLASYKLHGSYSQPHTTVTHHLDLIDSHGLVLLNGEVVEGRGVSAEEGRWLVMCLQKFYDFEGHGGGIGQEKRQGLLEKFSKGDQGFNIEELVKEAERVS